MSKKKGKVIGGDWSRDLPIVGRVVVDVRGATEALRRKSRDHQLRKKLGKLFDPK